MHSSVPRVLISCRRSNALISRSGVEAVERLGICSHCQSTTQNLDNEEGWKESGRKGSCSEKVDEIATYPGTMHEIIYAAKLPHRRPNHHVHTLAIRNVDLNGHSAVVGVSSQRLALEGGAPYTFGIEVCEDDTLHTGFSKRESSFFADARSGLRIVSWLSL